MTITLAPQGNAGEYNPKLLPIMFNSHDCKRWHPEELPDCRGDSERHPGTKPDLRGIEAHAAYCSIPQRSEFTHLRFPVTSEPTFKLKINISKSLIIIFTIWLMLTK